MSAAPVVLPEWAPRLLTPGEAAGLLGVPPRILRELCEAGQVRAVDLPRAEGAPFVHHRYYAAEIEALAADRRLLATLLGGLL